MLHRYPEKPSMLKLLELFASSRDMIYGESHPNRVSEVQDETAELETRASSSKQPSTSTMFSTSDLTRQDTQADLLADSETIGTQPTSLSHSWTRIFVCIH